MIHFVAPSWVNELVHVCYVPLELGSPTKLKEVNGRIICETESGIPLIVPVSRGAA